MKKNLFLAKLFGLTVFGLTWSLSTYAVDHAHHDSSSSDGCEEVNTCGSPRHTHQLDQHGQTSQTATCDQISQAALCDQNQVLSGNQQTTVARNQSCGAQLQQLANCTPITNPNYMHQYNAHLDSCILTKQCAVGNLGNCLKWQGRQWSNAHLDVVLKHIDMNKSDVRNTLLTGKLSHIDLANSVFHDVTFSQVKFHNVDFTDATLTNVLFEKPTFKGHLAHRNKFDGATLTNVTFVGALSNASFKNAHLTNVSVTCADHSALLSFEHAYVWNGARWVEFEDHHMKRLGYHFNQCKNKPMTINLTDWLQAHPH